MFRYRSISTPITNRDYQELEEFLNNKDNSDEISIDSYEDIEFMGHYNEDVRNLNVLCKLIQIILCSFIFLPFLIYYLV